MSCDEPQCCDGLDREREVDELDDLLRLLGATCSNSQGCACIESGVGVSSASSATPFELEANCALSQRFALRLNGRSAFTRPWMSGSTSLIFIACSRERIRMCGTVGARETCNGSP